MVQQIEPNKIRVWFWVFSFTPDAITAITGCLGGQRAGQLGPRLSSPYCLECQMGQAGPTRFGTTRSMGRVGPRERAHLACLGTAHFNTARLARMRFLFSNINFHNSAE